MTQQIDAPPARDADDGRGLTVRVARGTVRPRADQLERLEQLHAAGRRVLGGGELAPPDALVLRLDATATARAVPDGPDRRGPRALAATVPPEAAEPALASLLLLGRPSPSGPAGVLAAGLLETLRDAVEGRDPAGRREELGKLVEQGRLPALDEVLLTPDGQLQGAVRQIASDVVAHLLAQHGADAVIGFARALLVSHPDLAAQAVLATTVGEIESTWVATLALPPNEGFGMTGFVKRAMRYLRPHWKLQMVVLAGTVVATAFTVLLPLSFKFVIDRAIIPGDVGQLQLITFLLFLLFLLNSASTLLKDYYASKVSARVLNDLRARMFDRLQKLSGRFYSRADTGDLMSRTSADLMVVDDAISQLLPMTLSLVLSLVASTAVLFALEWRLALLSLLPLPLFIIGPVVFGPKAGRASVELQNDTALVATSVQENLSAQPVVKAYGLEDHTKTQFHERLLRLESSTVRSRFLGSVMGSTGEFGMSLIQLVILGAGGYLVIKGDFELGSLVAFQALIGNVAAPLFSLSDLSQVLQQATGGLRRVEELLEEPLTVADRPDARPLPQMQTGLAFEEVVFSYSSSQRALDRVSLEIPSGSTVAVVGPSGSGKSTLINVLMRFYDPDAGRVVLDGVDVREGTLASLRQQTGAVFQESFLFNASIRDNIRMGRLDASDEDVERAARAAEIHDVVQAMPFGYDTFVGERGGRLSGGQRQRVALARAVLRDPALLVLDEPTSALDPETEAAIADTLHRVGEGRTVLWVTHRLDTIAKADLIVVMERGRVAEAGTHARLLKAGGVYRRLWDQQHAGKDGDADGVASATRRRQSR